MINPYFQIISISSCLYSMLNSSSLVKYFALKLLFIFGSVLINKCDGKNKFQNKINQNFSFKEISCPFIETLSYGSDIDIKCNSTYLTFNEINVSIEDRILGLNFVYLQDKKLNWKFADQSLFCQQQKGFVNQCNITKIEGKYLKVPLRSLKHNEYACIYCPINVSLVAF